MKKSAGTGRTIDDPYKAGRTHPRLAGFKSVLKARFKGHRGSPVPVPDHARQIRDLALTVWENRDDAEEFLSTPHALLQGQAPAVVARTPEGAERVRRILLALEYGLPV
jgi:hypothetical protein